MRSTNPLRGTDATPSHTVQVENQARLPQSIERASSVFEEGMSQAAPFSALQMDELWATFLMAQSLQDPIQQADALNRCMRDITPANVSTLMARLNPQDLKGIAAAMLFDFWATALPGEAAEWAQTQTDAETCQSLTQLAALRWAVSDLNQALAWARSLPEGEPRTAIMAAISSEAVRSAPLEALRLGIELPPSVAKTELIRRAAAEWAISDCESALEWAKQIEDEDLRQQVTGQMVAAFANQDPVNAAKTALLEMAPGVEQDRAVVSIIQHWVQSDPEGASAWVSQFPDGPLGKDAMENLVNLWSSQDLVASGNWLLSLPPSELQASGVLAYSRVLKRTNPELARSWAGEGHPAKTANP